MGKNLQLSPDQVLAIWARVSVIRTWTERRALKILKSRCPDTTKQIAVDFGVDRKTVNRIANQECYRDITEAFERNCLAERATHPMLGRVVVPATPDDLRNLDSDLVYYKNLSRLQHDLPLDFGYYRGWDRFQNVVTDGTIMLHDDYGLELAVRAKDTGINEGPFFASKAREIPTFEAFELMTQEIGGRLLPQEVTDTEVCLVDPDKSLTVFLARRFYTMSIDLKCEIRLSPGNPFVYLVKTTPDKIDTTSGRISHDGTIRVVAVIATMGA